MLNAKIPPDARAIDRQNWIYDCLMTNDYTVAEIRDAYVEKFQTPLSAMNNDIRKAKNRYNEYLEELAEAKAAATSALIAKDASRMAKSKFVRQKQREEMVAINMEIITNGTISEIRIIDNQEVLIERSLKPQELAAIQNVTNAILAEISKIEGDYPTNKSELTINTGSIDSFILDD